jgi:hypothetical protein
VGHGKEQPAEEVQNGQQGKTFSIVEIDPRIARTSRIA